MLRRTIQAVKRNKEDAQDLALYIGNLTEATLRPFGDMDTPTISPNLKRGIDGFTRCVPSRFR